VKTNKQEVKLTYRKHGELYPVVIVDSNYTTDKSDWCSVVLGNLHTLGDSSLVGCPSKKQNSVTPSVTEVEYTIASTGGQEIISSIFQKGHSRILCPTFFASLLITCRSLLAEK
jgi:hypothetical protein